MEKPKILIVDDDPDLRRALKIRLRANHYDTVQAADGYSAIAVAQKEQPNLIILDLGLPAGDGFVVLRCPECGRGHTFFLPAAAEKAGKLKVALA